MDKIQRLRQVSMSVEEYRQQMELLLLRAGLRVEERTSIATFLSGLNMEVRDKVELLPYRDLEELVRLGDLLVICRNHENRKNFQKWFRSMNLAKMTPMLVFVPYMGTLMYEIFLHSGKVSTHFEIVSCEMTKLPLPLKII